MCNRMFAAMVSVEGIWIVVEPDEARVDSNRKGNRQQDQQGRYRQQTDRDADPHAHKRAGQRGRRATDQRSPRPADRQRPLAGLRRRPVSVGDLV